MALPSTKAMSELKEKAEIARLATGMYFDTMYVKDYHVERGNGFFVFGSERCGYRAVAFTSAVMVVMVDEEMMEPKRFEASTPHEACAVAARWLFQGVKP